MQKKYYLTTPLYYVNASPHIGHSYTTIAADCMARYKRARMGKDNVHFLTGTDEHGQKIQKAADEAGLSPQLFADKVSEQFRRLWRDLDVSYDDFIRTTEERHVKTVQRALEILYAKGEIYESQYQGWYCTPCETFWVESQLRDSLCPDCKRPVEKITENNYFLRMTKHQKWLVEHIEANPLFIRPESRRNETLSFLRSNELGDLPAGEVAIAAQIHGSLSGKDVPGIRLKRKPFTESIRRYANEGFTLYYLHEEGKDSKGVKYAGKPAFILGDHKGLDPASERFLDTTGAERVSLGPHSYLASHCITMVNCELDMVNC